MKRLFRPVRAIARPGVSRSHRAPPRLRVVAGGKAREDDLSSLILYGQG